VVSITAQADLSPRDFALERGAVDIASGAGIKRILACVDGTVTDRVVLDHATQVAQRFASHIDVLHVRFDVRGASVGPYEQRTDRLLGISVERAGTETAVHARRHFEQWRGQSDLPLRETGAAAAGPSARWREIVGYESEVVGRLGRLSDLIVVPRPRQGASSFSLMALETALFDTCRPVLMVPEGANPNLFHRATIAWNGSLEAARAVGFALPFLAQCAGVSIFTAPENKHRADADELLDYLGWHGIIAERIVEDSRSTGESLLARAGASQAGLIVMGAYTHGHFRQFFFGGVTRHIMKHAAVPILMAH
jgi:nucleotide-binding universal stress UspA family protein